MCCVSVRAPEAALRASRLDIRSARLFERATKLRSSKRPDGRSAVVVPYLASIGGLPQVAITTSVIFLGE